jgi:4-aminobutyrate--pyruvate transaminase
MDDQARPNSPAARDVAYHVHPQTNLHAHETAGPMIITRGEGVRVYDDEGRGYIDAMAGLWSAALGFSEKRLADAAYRQMCELPYASTFAHRSNTPVIELAERLTAMAPAPLTRALFCNSGSEAVDTAMKLVWYYWNAHGRPEKKKVIARGNAYHGSTIAAASLTGLERMQRDFDLPIDRVVRAPCPHHAKYAKPGESEHAFSARMAEELDALICAEGPETVGAMFAEPLQGAGGVIVPPAGYFEAIKPVLDKHEVLLVADEVICGFGRTGALWGSQTFNVVPDMLTCAKALSASYIPIAATLMSEKVYEALRDQSKKIGQFGHGYTYSGHPVAAAVALETLKIYEEIDIAGRAAAAAPILQDGLRTLAGHDMVFEVRGVGMIAGVELDPERAAGLGPKVAEAARERGILVRALGDTLAFCPPIVIEHDDLRQVVAGFCDALEAVNAQS